MSSPEGDTGKESPLFALKPVIILDVVGVCEQGIQGEEWKGIQMQVPGNCCLESCPGYFWRLNVNANPIKRR